MTLLVSAIVQIVVGIIEKVLPTFFAMWAKRQADVKLAGDLKKIEDAVKEAQK